jgi:hypothetical protein
MPSKKSPAAPSAALMVPKAPLCLSAEALFRHGVVSQVAARVLGGEFTDTVVCEVASCSYRAAPAMGPFELKLVSPRDRRRRAARRRFRSGSVGSFSHALTALQREVVVEHTDRGWTLGRAGHVGA